MADMATRSVQINKLNERITIHAEDLRNAPNTLGRESINAIVCNPPYGKQGGVIPSQTKRKGLLDMSLNVRLMK